MTKLSPVSPSLLSPSKVWRTSGASSSSMTSFNRLPAMTEKSENERPGLTPIAPFRFIFRKTSKARFYNLHGHETCKGSDLRMCRYPGNHWFESAPPKGARGRLGMVEDQVLLTVKIYRPVKKDLQQPTLTLNNTRCLQVWSLTQQLFRWLLQSRNLV